MVQELGGFSLEDSDKVRKAIGKKKVDLMVKYRDQFVDGAIDRGCPEYEAEAIWDKIAAGAEYSFNLSHSACYGITGYICNWLKSNYPMEFWTIALGEASDKKLPEGIAELNKLENGIKIMPPDINKSIIGFNPDFDTDEIFWSLDSIKFVGDAAVEKITEARDEDGKFFSLEEFIERVDGSKVNKRCIVNLIISGAFDKMYKINPKKPSDRLAIVREFFDLRKEDLPDEFVGTRILNNHFWALKQKGLCGYGDVDMKVLAGRHPKAKAYCDNKKFFSSEAVNKQTVLVGGILSKVFLGETKNGDPYGKLEIENESEIIKVMVWSDNLDSDHLLENSGNLVFLNGKVSFSEYDKKNIMTLTRSSQIIFID